MTLSELKAQLHQTSCTPDNKTGIQTQTSADNIPKTIQSALMFQNTPPETALPVRTKKKTKTKTPQLSHPPTRIQAPIPPTMKSHSPNKQRGTRQSTWKIIQSNDSKEETKFRKNNEENTINV